MAEKHGHPKAVLFPETRRDLREIPKWSETKFGRKAALRYEALLVQSLRDIEADPERPGSQERRELFAEGVIVYHLRFSRDRAGITRGIVQNPRHFLVYRRRDQKVIDILRILHDGRDLQRHLPEEYRRKDPDD